MTEFIKPLSWSESERLTALAAYDILDTPRERDFDDIAELASEVCGTPIAVVNLIGEGRQWFKAEIGLGVRETPLDTSFCAHAILQSDFMMIPDATKDSRFECNPLVTGEPGLRFYAGALLKTSDELPLGTLCVLDFKPRELTPLQERTLRVLARQVMKQLDLRQALRSRSDAARRHRLIMDSATDYAIVALNGDGLVTDWNEGARRTLGWREEEIMGKPADLLFTEEDRLADVPGGEMRQARETGHAVDERWHRRKDGSRFWGHGMMTPLKSEGGTHIGYVKVMRDQTAEREADEQRGHLMRELDHRVKNTLAMVQAIASQTLRSLHDAEASKAFESRIIALSRAHDILLAETWTSARMSAIVTGALDVHGRNRFETGGPDLKLGPKAALSLALIIHELATNATKHGALSRDSGRVSLTWEIVSGDGPSRLALAWVERGGPTVVPPSRKGFGSRLIRMGLAGSGGVTVEYPPEGLVCRIEASIQALGDGG